MADDPTKNPVADEEPVLLGRKSKALARRLIARYPRFAPAAGLLVMLLWLATLPFAWLCWWIGLPEIWQWAGDSMWRMAAALFGSLILLFAPAWAWMFLADLTGVVAEASLGDDKANIAKARERVRETEEDALKRFEKDDDAGLLPLLRYSRAQLDAYYAMGLGQTRRAFVNAALAMWLGFLLLIAGMALYIAPLRQFGIEPPSGDFKWLILASAAIIEIVSALFLWVYRSTIGQLTFYYRLQMQSHTAILCFRIATTMGKADEAKGAIIDKLLGASLAPERPAPMGTKGLAALLPGGG